MRIEFNDWADLVTGQECQMMTGGRRVYPGSLVSILITYMKKLLDSDWLRKECKNE